MTGMRDANGFTTVITFKGVRDGHPRWTWASNDQPYPMAGEGKIYRRVH